MWRLLLLLFVFGISCVLGMPNLPKYKLGYFNARGSAETARMLFALADKEYQDARYTAEQWIYLKPYTPFGELPVLYVDDVQIGQSLAIYRFLARRFGLAGKSDLDAARGDMIVDAIDDVNQPLMRILGEIDPVTKAELKKTYEEETLPSMLDKLERLLGERDFFLGQTITWVDVVFFNAISGYQLMGILCLGTQYRTYRC